MQTHSRTPTLATLALVATLAGIIAPPTAAQNGKARKSTKPALPAASSGYVRWSDPKEGAFSLEAPKGWKTQGGLVRVGITDVRESVLTMSPDGNQVIVIGDTSLPTFASLPDPARSAGAQEGSQENVGGNFTMLYLHYMPALEFNRFYVQKKLSNLLANIQVGEEKDHPELARKIEVASHSGSGGPTHYTVAITEFSGQEKQTGKKFIGVVMSVTERFGDRANGGIWSANPTVLACLDDDRKEARIKATTAVYMHMFESRRNNQAWQHKEMVRQEAASRKAIEEANRQIAALVASTPSVGGGGGTTGGRAGQPDLMAAYWKRNAIRANLQHQTVNYISDHKDIVVVDGNIGTIMNVPDK